MIDRRHLMLAGAGAAGLAACSPKEPGELIAPEVPADLSGFALNVESWFADDPFDARFDLAAKSGFGQVEFWFIDSWKRDARILAGLAKSAGVKVAQIVGDAPELGRPQTRAAFVENCKKSVENAAFLNCNIVTLTGHQDLEGISKADSLKHYADHMAAVAPIFEDAKIFAAIEPFNPYDHPGHFIYGSKDALNIVNGIDSPYMKLNWDLFHMQRTEGELIGNLKRGASQICYAQIADTPDRGQPGTGDVNYVNVIKALRAGGYGGPIGLELWAKDKDYSRAIADIQTLARALSAKEKVVK